MNSNQLISRYMQKLRSIALTLLFVLTAMLLAGCASHKKEAEALVKEGASKSQQLADYYDSLIQKENDYLTISSYTVGFELSDKEEKQLAKVREAYASRAELARQLKATYDALGKLIDYDAPGEVKGAVDDLLTAVLKQVPHPDQLDSDLFKGVVGKIAGKLVEIQQEKQFRKNVPRVLEVLDGVAEIFETERDLYAETCKRYENEAAILARKMAGTADPGTDQGTGMGLMQKFVEPYGVKMFLSSVTDPDTRRKNIDFVVKRIDKQSKQNKVAALTQARNMSASLYALVRTHRVFLKAAPTAPLLKDDEVTNVATLSAILKQALIARDQWEQHESDLKKNNENYEIKPYEASSNAFVSDYVARLLSPGVKEGLKTGDSSDKFRKALVADLNRIIETGSIIEGILSEQNKENLNKLRTFVLGPRGDGDQKDLRKLRDEVLGEIRTKVEAEHAKHSGDKSSPLPDNLRASIRRDPAGKALTRLNRGILAFVYQNMIAAA